MEEIKNEIMEVVRSYLHENGGGSIEGSTFRYKKHTFTIKIEGK